MRQLLGLHRDKQRRRATLDLRLERLESRELFSAQPPLIADATPYSAAFINGVFRDALDRPADGNALNWLVTVLDQGIPAETVAGAVVDSNEYAGRVVATAYQQYLGRDANAADIAFWVNALHSGMRDEQLAAALVASDEFYLDAGGNDTAWLQAAYQAVLGRAASGSDIGWGIYQLKAGVSRSALADSIAMSLEHEQQLVEADFTHYLHTNYSDAWYTTWATRLAQGQTTNETLIIGMLGSNAYYEAQTGVPPSIVPMPGISSGWATRAAQIQATAAQGTAPLVFLGDSLTERWQLDGEPLWSQFYAPLNALNAGIGGDTTQNVLWRIENGELDGLSPKVVVLLVGVNDFAASDTPQEVADGVAADVEALRQHLPNAKIMVLSILPAVLAPPLGSLMPVISQTNAIIAGLSDGQHVFYVNLWPAFTNPDGSTRSELHVSDGLHLNAAGYTVLEQSIAPELDQLLTEP